MSIITKAEFWPRLVAFLIDAIILRTLWYIWFYFIPPSSQNASYGISFLISVLYFVLLEGGCQSTIGMMAMHLRIVNAHDNSPIGFPIAISRTIGRIFCQLTIGIGYLSMLSNKNKQALHDRISQTFVIYR